MDTTQQPTFKLSKRLIITVSSIVIALILVFSLYGYVNGLQQTDVAKETQLSRQYESLKAGLDAFLSSAQEEAGVTSAQSANFDKIMMDAVQGRYQQNGSPTSAQVGSGTLFSAIQEAYPNLDSLNSSYSRILDTISSGRASFSDNQQKLQDELRAYDQWRKSGFVRSYVVSHMIGAPTSNLAVNNGQGQLTGQQAYNVMSHVITSSTTQNAFSSGTLQPQDFFGTNGKQ